MTDNDLSKYIGPYYCYELDTSFEVIRKEKLITMRYLNKSESHCNDLLDFTHKDKVFARTIGDWGADVLPFDFYGSDERIDYFVMQNGCGHFYFVRNANN